MTSPLIGGYDPDLNITLSVRQDFILLLRLKADDDGTAPNIHDIFPAGTTIDLRFYPDMAAVRAGEGGLARSGIGGYTGTWLTGTFIVPSGSLGLTLGAGGVGGQSEGGGKGAPGSSGGTTSINGPSGLIASAPGGLGGKGANSGGSGQNGKTISPQTLSAFGQTFAAGSGGTGNAGTGGIGAGGAGGNGGIFGSFTKGGTGGPARIWLRWRSY